VSQTATSISALAFTYPLLLFYIRSCSNCHLHIRSCFFSFSNSCITVFAVALPPPLALSPLPPHFRCDLRWYQAAKKRIAAVHVKSKDSVNPGKRVGEVSSLHMIIQALKLDCVLGQCLVSWMVLVLCFDHTPLE
jgi:hypothetical protein